MQQQPGDRGAAVLRAGGHAGRRNWGPTWNYAQLVIAAEVEFLPDGGDQALAGAAHRRGGSDREMTGVGGPKQLVVYQDSRHSLNGASVTNGPDPRVMQAEWITRRLQGQPMQSERWYVENSGRVAKTQLA